MKEMLTKKQEELAKSLNSLMQQKAALEEQITMHRGALQYNEMLIKETEAEEAAKAEPAKATETPAESPLKAVE